MTINLPRIAEVAAGECVRQQVGLKELGGLLEAYEWALNRQGRNILPELHDFIYMARLVEPDKGWGLRTTPVTFANGGTSCAPEAVSRAVLSLIDGISRADLYSETIREITKQFLWIHPFRDGNGRVGWILYNWLNGSLEEPVPLPDFNW